MGSLQDSPPDLWTGQTLTPRLALELGLRIGPEYLEALPQVEE